jgi:hypothetical protein
LICIGASAAIFRFAGDLFFPLLCVFTSPDHPYHLSNLLRVKTLPIIFALITTVVSVRVVRCLNRFEQSAEVIEQTPHAFVEQLTRDGGGQVFLTYPATTINSNPRLAPGSL